MNVFVLCAGRTGSVAFYRACAHITNFTSAHESRSRFVGKERLRYPRAHIEIDNRLAWFLGRLDEEFGDKAFYVHLTRDAEQVAQSHARRWSQLSIARAFRESVLMGADVERLVSSRELVTTVNSNIEFFLKNKSHVFRFGLENASVDFYNFWQWIGAEGKFEAAADEWNIRHNPSKKASRLASLKRRARAVVRAAFQDI